MVMEIEKCKGDVFKASNGGGFIITKYVGCNEVYIKFLETGYETVTSNNHIESGKIRDRLRPSVCGVGILGFSDTKCGDERLKEYLLWKDMITRCYSKKSLSRKPSYLGCKVSNNFLHYDYFKDWCHKQIGFSNEGWHLDKDILIKGNKIYSEDTCCFVPQEINNLFTNKKVKNNLIKTGVLFNERTKRYSVGFSKGSKTKHLGYFGDEKEAFAAYKQAKEAYIKEVANKWKDQIDPRVYEVLMDWTISVGD